jgi:Tol biopolymer transport system component
LPDAVAADPERLARFQREAEVLASLNHPNIAGIYGLEESGGMSALVMELVGGEDLSQRIAKGAIPIDEALPIAKQMAEALEGAHEQGIIHRDLKPANVKVRPDGTVKVLDFGLAKLVEPVGSASGPAALLNSPTITSPAMMTGVGVILGTAAYMSPEQAKGRPADRRSDIWAFGCVLYEMLTGRRAFDGEDMAEVLGAVVRLEPNWDVLPAHVSQPVQTLLQRCLVKDRRKRIADIAVALFVLDHQADIAGTRLPLAALRPHWPLWSRIAALAVGALMTAALGGALVWLAMRPSPRPVERLTISATGTTALTIDGIDRSLAITPDGKAAIYVGNNGTQLFVRALDQLDPRPIATGTDLRAIFTSPDSQWVGFVERLSIKKIRITGGPIVPVVQVNGGIRGAAWGPHDTIIFATASPTTGLQRVPADGGEPTVLTTPDLTRGESDHLWPEFLPGGDKVLFTITPAAGGLENGQIALLDLQTGVSKVLIRGGSHAHYLPTGHLIYGVAGTLRAVAFDLRRLEAIGTPAPALENVATSRGGAANVAVAANGSLVYIRGGAAGAARQTVVSVDRDGRDSSLPGLLPAFYREVKVSPDGTRLAVAVQDDISIYDFGQKTLTRLTTDPALDYNPLWTPDGQRIVFSSRRAGYPELFWRPSDGSGRDERIFERGKDLTDLRANGWSADSKQLLFTELSASGRIGQVVIERPSEVKLLVETDSPSSVSPNGRWIAYHSHSDASGHTEVFVERYPELGNRQQISWGGGRLPIWSRTGRELFFSSLDTRQILAVQVQSGTTLAAAPPTKLFEIAMQVSGGQRPYDIAPDGRFLIIRSGQETGVEAAPQIVYVPNWTEELKRLMPTN